MSIRTCVHAYVRPSTKSFFNFSEIWHVGRGRWVMHNGMQYDLIQGQVYEPFIVQYGANLLVMLTVLIEVSVWHTMQLVPTLQLTDHIADQSRRNAVGILTNCNEFLMTSVNILHWKHIQLSAATWARQLMFDCFQIHIYPVCAC